MYEIIKNVITNGKYELEDMLRKINIFWLQKDITDEQKDELTELARQKANPKESYAPLQKQIESLFKNVGEIAKTLTEVNKRVTALESGEVEPSEPEEPEEEYPEYVQPTGAHDAYHAGDKVTYEENKYICIAPESETVVWNPDVMKSYWQLVE